MRERERESIVSQNRQNRPTTVCSCKTGAGPAPSSTHLAGNSDEEVDDGVRVLSVQHPVRVGDGLLQPLLDSAEPSLADLLRVEEEVRGTCSSTVGSWSIVFALQGTGIM